MKFFEKTRPQVFLYAPKLRRDKKTQKRLWQFTLIVTFTAELAKSCDVAIRKNFEHISDQSAAAVDVMMASEVPGCAIDFFAQIDDAEPVLHLEGVDLGGLRMTRDKTVVEFWFSGEHVNEGGIHDFMKPYAFTRFWAQFSPEQADLPMKPGKGKK